MIVFDLNCARCEHVFEAWFGSSTAYEDQRKRKLIACPVCGATRVSKAIMAPNVSAKGNSQRMLTPASDSVPVAKAPADESAPIGEMLGKLAAMQAKVLEKSEWVGRQFDQKARAMDAGEIVQTPIHGEVSKSEAKALMEDGIAVAPLLFPVVPPQKRN